MSISERVKTVLDNYESDNPGTKANLARILMQGRLGGTGKLVILPVDQGFEHGPARSGTGIGIQVASTMVGYPLGGILIGLVLDNVFDTMPWITIGLMFTAFAGACVHVVRMTKNRAG